ncbi:MAG: tetratricopeptide repeat protein [Vicinamibacteria bacterium]
MAADFSWGPPLTVLAMGAAFGGLVVILRSRAKSRVPSFADVKPERADLQRQYDALVRRLAEGTSAEERSGIELQAAQVLMKLDGVASAADTSKAEIGPRDAPAVSAANAPKPVSAMTGFVYGVVSMAVLGALIYLAFQGSTPRAEGGIVTGGQGMGPAAASAAPPQEGVDEKAIAALEEEVRKAPRDIPHRIELARAYLQKRDLIKVFDQTKAVLEIEPGNPLGLTYQGLVRVAMGQADQAEAMLLEAIKKDPNIEDAYIHLAIARIQRGNRAGAEQAIQDAQKLFPQDRAELAQMFTQLTQAADQKATAAPAEPSETTDTTATGTATDEGGSSGDVVVVVDLPKGITVPPSALLFVIVREAGFGTGPPVAVKRLPAANFPITVTLTNKDSMAGESLPGLVRIDARIDRDGDPLTKDPRDPVASEDNVRPGSGQILLVLAPVK